MKDDWIQELVRRADEPLRPELQAYLQESTNGLGQVLRHPLVYQIPYTHASLANDAYAAKKRELRRARTKKDWHTVIWLHERPYRFWALTTYRSRMREDEFWGHARNIWVDSENVWQHLDDWIELFTEAPAHEQLMTADELEAFTALSDPVPVYRGATLERNEDGISYTTSHERAEWFARRWQRDGQVVVHATVPKHEVVMYVLSRSEHEVVVRSLESVSVTQYEEVSDVAH